jgi:hypothetical protein
LTKWGKSYIIEVSKLTGGYKMGYTVMLECNEEVLEETTITYNFYEVYKKLNWNVRNLDGSPAHLSVNRLGEKVKALGTKKDSDRWKPTKGNAGAALKVLLGWAKEYPNATWRVLN